jgi:hypothetical protein
MTTPATNLLLLIAIIVAFMVYCILAYKNRRW